MEVDNELGMSDDGLSCCLVGEPEWVFGAEVLLPCAADLIEGEWPWGPREAAVCGEGIEALGRLASSVPWLKCRMPGDMTSRSRLRSPESLLYPLSSRGVRSIGPLEAGSWLKEFTAAKFRSCSHSAALLTALLKDDDG